MRIKIGPMTKLFLIPCLITGYLGYVNISPNFYAVSTVLGIFYLLSISTSEDQMVDDDRTSDEDDNRYL